MKTEWEDRLKEVIAEKGIKPADLIRWCKISKSAVSQWKSGRTKPTPANIFKIADQTGYSARWLATGEGPKQVKDENEDARNLYRAYIEATETARQIVDVALQIRKVEGRRGNGE